VSDKSWGARWLDLIETAPAFDDLALRRGSDYVAFDWQLDVEIEAGRAATTATSGKRMQYVASITVPTLSASEINQIVESIAATTERIAAVLDGELPADLDQVLAIDPLQIVPACNCQSVDRPCKHAAAVAHLVADAIADNPFDLLHLRGLPQADLVHALAASRRDPADGTDSDGADSADVASEPPVQAQPSLVFSHPTGVLPSDPAPPARPGRLPPFPTPPPAGASFTEQGLRTLADDGARRAAELLSEGSSDWVDLDATTDLARRAAAAEGTSEWKHLVERSQATSQELRARAVAWRVGGAPAVVAHIAPAEIQTDPDDRSVQRRRTHDGVWVRFDKVKGRWLATSVEPAPEAKTAP